MAGYCAAYADVRRPKPALQRAPPGSDYFNDELIKVFGRLSREVLTDMASNDPLTRKVYDSYMDFLAGVMDWGELSETGYRNTRRLALA